MKSSQPDLKIAIVTLSKNKARLADLWEKAGRI
jgi:hypothetical protein